ncbi:MAG: exodeoxyribonuclease VII large subunit [Anaerovoracaceae bacterium]|jgi:exodeoxyribonuclease VII large subunit
MAIKPIRVSQLNGYIKRVLQTDLLLSNVSVVGEVSNLKFHSSGHVYFTLKDKTSKLNCFLPSDQFARLHYELAEGMEITAVGYISVYERGGTYSLNIRDIVVEGIGNLSIAFEKLKLKLKNEGLFEEKYKKAIPKFPKQIVIITSETGAAVKDIIKIIKSRNDITNVIVYPCLVQGINAAVDISRAIDEVNRLFPETDTIIIGRGGGSIEELWAFNEEIVARSIFLSEIPIISAVGHETDFTIADYVADIRAATPSEAAQIAVPDIKELIQYLNFYKDNILNTLKRFIHSLDLRVSYCNMESLRNQLLNRLKFYSMMSDKLSIELIRFSQDKLSVLESQLEKVRGKLQSGNPFEIIEQGYAVILNAKGHFAKSVEAFEPGDSLTIIFKDGKINCSVDKIRRAPYDQK